jgi:hypothetical protein
MGSSDWREWLYVAACVLLPGAWGAFTAWLFARLDRRRKLREEQNRLTIDYMI